MRPKNPACLLLPLSLLLAGCDAFLGWGAAVNVVSLTTVGRTVPDLVVSAVTGRDCSIAHIDAGETRYCRADPLPSAASYCTRSLGGIDCWSSPPPGLPPPRPVADAPPVPAVEPQRWPLNRL
ncbi:hypothetical protein LPC08_01470 [Roseomonas sp. OT10]|uniref:hypothetical protein n=1 Tax=Roseomonas cutis TaxID=2897332 RepID=UPI001E611DF2|nr:hypothetical protein [Roseomonas sp. OT10]UFN49343.1 hypothetical protein LPC08_01470 [Roseomonas sp. OT10]